MIILSIRKDKPLAEIGVYDKQQRLAYETWHAHRQLAETLHQKIQTILKDLTLNWGSLEGLVVYKGPGSFTGLRIGLAAANALASGNSLPIVGLTGEDWIKQGVDRLLSNESDGVVLPEYGAPVHITTQKK